MLIFNRIKIFKSVIIGKNVKIHPFVVIYPNVVIEDNVEIFSGSIIGKLPKGANALSRKININSYKKVIIGNGSVLSPNSVIYTDVLIGSGTLIGDGASIREQVRIGNNCIISRYVTINYNTIIGNDTKIMDNSHITGNMIIGNNVFISVNVSSVNDNNIGRISYDENVIKGPSIEDYVSIGAGAILLPNVILKKGSIIGPWSMIVVSEYRFKLGNLLELVIGRLIKKIGKNEFLFNKRIFLWKKFRIVIEYLLDNPKKLNM